MDSLLFSHYEKGKKINYDKPYEAISLYQKSIERFTKIPPECLDKSDSLVVAKALYNQSNCRYEIDFDLKKALTNLERALNIRKEFTAPDVSSNSMGNTQLAIARIYEKLGELKAAENNFLAALNLYEPDKVTYYIPMAYNDLGEMHRKFSDFEQAIYFLEKGLEHPNAASDKQSRADLLTNLASTFKDQKAYNKSIIEYNAALELYESLAKEESYFEEKVDLVLNNLGLTYIENNQHEKGRSVLNKISEKDAAFYLIMGESYLKEGSFQEAVKEHQKALSLLIHGKPNQFSADTSLSDKALGKTEDKPRLLLYLESNANSAKGLGNSGLALQFFQAYDRTVDIMRQNHASNESKLWWINETQLVYENAIELAVETDQLEQALYFAEKSKSVLLMDQLRTLDAKQISRIPMNLLLKEKELLAFIATIEKESNLINAEQELQKLRVRFAEIDPQYFELRYGQVIPSLKEIQDFLKKDNNVLIEYFFGKENIYRFNISSEDIEVSSTRRTEETDRIIEDFKSSVLRHPEEIELSSILDMGANCYGVLLGNALPGQKRLIVIPDGHIHNLPFDALATPLNKQRFLIEEGFEIGYANSIKTLFQLQNKKTDSHLCEEEQLSESTFLAIAPEEYCCDNADLEQLPYSRQEVEEISGLFSGDILLGPDAKKEKALKEISKYSLVHFSSHASAGSEHDPWISLYDEKLSLAHIYTLELQAKMISLSACETGIGKNLSGEGVMSLARGFTYAGVPSVITTLSKVDNASTAEIISDMYGNLQEGMMKNTALQKAKLNFLQNPKKETTYNHRHPYYWASLIHIGDNSNIVEEGNFHEKMVYVVMASLLFFLIFFLLRRRSNLRK